MPNDARSRDPKSERTRLVRPEIMEDASCENSSSTTVQYPQQQQPHMSGADMYHAGAMGWPGSGRKVLPRDYTACEFADLVELIGMFCPAVKPNFPV